MDVKQTIGATVRDAMTRDPVCLERSDNVREVARIFDDNGISGAPVVNALGQLVGVVSKTDILHRALVGPLSSRRASFFELLADGLGGSDLDPAQLGVVEDFMSTEPVTARPEEPVVAVAQRMAKERVHRVIVVDEGNMPIGVVTALDALRTYPE